MIVSGLLPVQLGDLAFENNIRLHELSPAHASLEQAFMKLTASSVEFYAVDGGTGSTGPKHAVTAGSGPAITGKVA